ncbi:MAG: XRE family transcriptional regulator [Parahaliea sp.]
MAQVTPLIDTLKTSLKAAGITYAHIANALNLSESSIKRKFSKEEFTLAEVDRICSLCALDISTLVKRMDERHDRLQSLSIEQEREIADDLALLVVTVCVLNRWRFEDILKFYIFEEHQLIQMLARLDRLHLIELQVGNRIKLLVAPNFGWQPGGPIQKRFLKSIQKDFFAANFEQQEHCLIVLNGMLSAESNSELRRRMQRLAREFDQLNREDSSLDFNQRRGYTAVLALRDWRYEGFAALRNKAEAGL